MRCRTPQHRAFADLGGRSLSRASRRSSTCFTRSTARYPAELGKLLPDCAHSPVGARSCARSAGGQALLRQTFTARPATIRRRCAKACAKRSFCSQSTATTCFANRLGYDVEAQVNADRARVADAVRRRDLGLAEERPAACTPRRRRTFSSTSSSRTFKPRIRKFSRCSSRPAQRYLAAAARAAGCCGHWSCWRGSRNGWRPSRRCWRACRAIKIDDNWTQQAGEQPEVDFPVLDAANGGERRAALRRPRDSITRRYPEVGWRLCVDQFDRRARRSATTPPPAVEKGRCRRRPAGNARSNHIRTQGVGLGDRLAQLTTNRRSGISFSTSTVLAEDDQTRIWDQIRAWIARQPERSTKGGAA